MHGSKARPQTQTPTQKHTQMLEDECIHKHIKMHAYTRSNTLYASWQEGNQHPCGREMWVSAVLPTYTCTHAHPYVALASLASAKTTRPATVPSIVVVLGIAAATVKHD